MTRILAIPDSNGVIRVSCGADSLEIQVVTAGSLPAGPSPPPPDPFPPFSPFNQPLPNSPFDRPGAYIEAPRGKDGKVDLPDLVRRILDQTKNPALPDPSGVILRSDHANLHDVSDLRQKIAEAAPNLSIALDFSRPSRP